LADRAADRAGKSAADSNARKRGVKESAKRQVRSRDDEKSDGISVDDDDDEESVFRKAPSLFRVSKILNVASRDEGTLLQNGVDLMARALSIHQRGGAGAVTEAAPQGNLQDVVTTYLTTALVPGATAAGQYMGKGTLRELRTLSESLDALIRGEAAHAGDILMQRFRAIEMSVSDGHWSLAQHLELIPEQTVCSVPLGMRSELIREENRRHKFRDRIPGKGRGR